MKILSFLKSLLARLFLAHRAVAAAEPDAAAKGPAKLWDFADTAVDRARGEFLNDPALQRLAVDAVCAVAAAAVKDGADRDLLVMAAKQFVCYAERDNRAEAVRSVAWSTVETLVQMAYSHYKSAPREGPEA